MANHVIDRSTLGSLDESMESRLSKKRRLSVSVVEHPMQPKPKMKKRKKIKSRAYGENDDIDVHNALNRSIGKMDKPLLADHFAQRTKRFAPNLSLVELQDRQIPEHAFVDTSTWKETRVLRSLPSYLKTFAGSTNAEQDLSSSSAKPGSPHTVSSLHKMHTWSQSLTYMLPYLTDGLKNHASRFGFDTFVSPALQLGLADVYFLTDKHTLACGDVRRSTRSRYFSLLTRALKVFQTKESKIGKMFAKHIKLKAAIDYLKSTRVGIGVGTPLRLNDLIASGALSVQELKRIVVDASHVNEKKQGILDMRDTQEALTSLLVNPEIQARYGDEQGKVEILCF